LKRAVHDERSFARDFFSRLAEMSGDPAGGITRDTYGEGENWGHRVLSDAGRESGLDVSTDAAGNTYARWAAAGPRAKTILMGSHLDSVPRGGNFDGAAGVVAGLVATRALRNLGMRPPYSLAVMGLRAEESVWFEVSYIGGRAALGTLPDTALDGARRIDTGRSLSQHMTECGARPDLIRSGYRSIVPADIAAFVEVHIEQAPSLVESEKIVGICTGIPGNFRFPNARIVGRHDHVGTPRRFRRDAMMAAAAFAAAMDDMWSALDAKGTPTAMTFGRFHTDAGHHGLTIVPGLFHFSLDIRAYDEAVLSSIERELHRIIAGIEERYRVRFDLGRRASAPVGAISPEIIAGLTASAERQNISHMPLGSPASHDAAAFAAEGIPTAMLFVRNENGSHNPQEAMDIDDFLDTCTVLVDWLACKCME
jgi:N-carbamoyl-L-amino-acid hydrolase